MSNPRQRKGDLEVRIAARVTREDQTRLHQEAREAGMSYSEWLRLRLGAQPSIERSVSSEPVAG